MLTQPFRGLKRWIVYSLIAALVVVACPSIPIAIAQLPSLTNPANPSPLPAGIERRGTLESAGVRLDGKELFRIASPAVFNRSDPGSLVPVEIRANQIEANLVQLVSSQSADEPRLDPQTMRVLIETINGLPVLFVKDKTLVEPRVLLTVTDADAQYNTTSPTTLANRWQEILERELRQALELRQPEALKQQIITVIKVLGAVVGLTLGLGLVWGILGRRQRSLKNRQMNEQAVAQTHELATLDPTEELNNRSEGFLRGLHQYFSLQRRLQTIRFLRWVLFWAIVFIWVAGIAYSLNTFPQTRHIVRTIVIIPFILLITWFLTGLVNRLTDLIADRFIQNRQQEQLLTTANLQRIATITNVIKGLKMVLLYTISILWVLQWLNLAPGSILTIGAVLALAISFAAQNLVKDLVNGFLILIEDQFRIGDMIRIGATTGLQAATGSVENLNLRITQIRTTEGNLITLPNSTIAQVENMSRTWARADFMIEVAYDTEVDRALAVVRSTVDHMAQDPQWQEAILDTQEVFGVEQLSHSGIVIRVWIKTMPLKQWVVARELRRRLKNEFDRHQIQIGIPQQLLLQDASTNAVSLIPSSQSASDD